MGKLVLCYFLRVVDRWSGCYSSSEQVFLLFCQGGKWFSVYAFHCGFVFVFWQLQLEDATQCVIILITQYNLKKLKHFNTSIFLN